MPYLARSRSINSFCKPQSGNHYSALRWQKQSELFGDLFYTAVKIVNRHLLNIVTEIPRANDEAVHLCKG